MRAINWILDPTPTGYRASMRERKSQKKRVTICEERKEIPVQDQLLKNVNVIDDDVVEDEHQSYMEQQLS